MSDGFPQDVEIISNHVGAIGEAVFVARHEAPQPVEAALLDYCRSICPLEVGDDDIYITSQKVTGHTIYTAESDDEYLKWVPDVHLVAVATSNGTDWRQQFPVELKTGDASLTPTQRETIQHLANRTEYHPVIVRLSVDNLPDTFTIEDVQIVGDT